LINDIDLILVRRILS